MSGAVRSVFTLTALVGSRDLSVLRGRTRRLFGSRVVRTPVPRRGRQVPPEWTPELPLSQEEREQVDGILWERVIESSPPCKHPQSELCPILLPSPKSTFPKTLESHLEFVRVDVNSLSIGYTVTPEPT